MMPSTPQSISRSMSARLFTVHGVTTRPSSWASAMFSSVSSAWAGDQTS